ncbi:hypothetical protein T11_15122 [Trichinella zimbabwensis]|uniref:Uncharacterized protein n=1 Tax=Trichinella zimbabwensis TaxID=268475 RepID=A0A0V1HI72_9BILA|nr:hypothetical protein T11_15122 [Trichinella zimbabwensis]
MQEHRLLFRLLVFFLTHYFTCAALNNNDTAIIGSSTFGFFVPSAAVIGSCFALAMAVYMQWNTLIAFLRTICEHYRKKSNLCVNEIKPNMEKKSLTAIDEDDDSILMID